MDFVPIQIQVMAVLLTVRQRLGERLTDDRGEVTGTVILAIAIALAASAAAGIIAARIRSESEKLGLGVAAGL